MFKTLNYIVVLNIQVQDMLKWWLYQLCKLITKLNKSCISLHIVLHDQIRNRYEDNIHRLVDNSLPIHIAVYYDRVIWRGDQPIFKFSYICIIPFRLMLYTSKHWQTDEQRWRTDNLQLYRKFDWAFINMVQYFHYAP